jgi:DNA-binding XRE family transcriptional regulator
MEPKKKPLSNKSSVKSEKKKKVTKSKISKLDIEEAKKVYLAFKELRESEDVSSETFANKSELGRTWFGEIERGKKDIRLTSFFRILRAFKITPIEFFTRMDELVKNSEERIRKKENQSDNNPKFPFLV